MVTERQRIDGFVSDAKKSGATDQEIYNQLLASKKLPNLQGFILDAKKGGANDSDIAQHLGLKLQKDLGTQPPIKFKAYDWKAEQNKAMKQKAKEAGPSNAVQSALLGFSDLGAGVLQGGSYLADKVSQGINKVAGTNLDTNSYNRVTKERKDVNDWHQLRRQANDQGFDWNRLGGQIASTAPIALSGGTSLAQVAGRGALTGGGIGVASYAPTATERQKNTAMGAVGGAAGGALGSLIGKGATQVARKINAKNITTHQVDEVINRAFKQSDDAMLQGLKVESLSNTAKENIRKEVKSLLGKGKQPDLKTLERLAVFSDLKSKGVDLRPTGKQATGNPQLWTKETELSKLDGGESLNKRYINQGDELTNALNDFQGATGGTSTGKLQTGESIISSLNKQDEARKQVISTLYKLAKDHTGNDLQLNAEAIARNAKQMIDDNFALPDRAIPALMSRLKPFLPNPKDSSYVPKQFTLKDKELLVKQINAALPKLDQQNKVAFGLVRDSLEQETDDALIRVGGTLQGEAKTAWDAARKAASERFGLIKRNPALQQAIDDVAPDKFFQQQVLSANVRDVKALVDEIKSDPQAVNNVRQEIIRFIANKTVSDTTGNVSPKAMNNAIKSIGDEKLAMFFSPEELKHLKNLNAASRYLFSQPRGSNVNNSNSASAFANMMGYMGLLKRIPLVGPKVEQLANSGVRGVNAQIKISQGTNALPRTAKNTPLTPRELATQEKLIKLGIITGSNAAKEK